MLSLLPLLLLDCELFQSQSFLLSSAIIVLNLMHV